MALPTFVAAGASAATATTGGSSVTPALPTGWAAGDLLVLVAEHQSATLNAITGWSNIGTGTVVQSTTTPTALTARYKIATSTETAPTVTVAATADHVIARIFAFRGVSSTAPINVSATNVQNTSTTAVSVPGATTTVAQCLVVAAWATGTDAASTTMSSAEANASLASPAVTEIADNWTNSGNGGGFGVAYGGKATAGAYSATTATLTTANTQALISFAIAPAPPAVAATAALTSAVSLSAAGTQTQLAPAALTTAATLAATGTQVQPATAALATAVALTAAGTLPQTGTATLATASAISTVTQVTAALTTHSAITSTTTLTPTTVGLRTRARMFLGSPSAFVSRVGPTFYRFGQPFTFGSGVNLYYAAARQPLVGAAKALGSTSNGYLDKALADLDATSGGKIKVVRFWAYQNLAVTSGSRDWTAIDQVFRLAGARGFLVIPVLADEWGDVGEGGVTKTVDWFTGGYANAVGPNDTVTYKAWVAEFATRYANEPSILYVEFINEGSPYADTSGTLLADNVGLDVNKGWAKDVADTYRTYDTNHLLCEGLNYNNSGTKNYTTNYEQIVDYANTDIINYHDYSGDANNTTSANEVTDLVNLRSIAVRYARPLVVGEVGVHIAAGASRSTDYDGKLTRYAVVPSGQTTSAYAGALPWVYNDTTSYTGSYVAIDNLYDLRPDVDSASFTVLTSHGSALPTAPVAATAALTTAVSLSATASAPGSISGTAALTTAVTLAAPGVLARPATAALTTAVGLTAGPTQVQPATATLATAVALTATGTLPGATAVLTTAVGLSATVTLAQAGAATLTTAVTLTAPGTLAQAVAASLSTAVTLTAPAIQAQPSTAALATSVTLTATAALPGGNVALSTAVGLTAPATLARAAAATLSTAVTITATADRTIQGVSAFSTTVTLTAPGTLSLPATAALVTAVTLVTFQQGMVPAAAALVTFSRLAGAVRIFPQAAGYGRLRLVGPQSTLVAARDLRRGVHAWPS